ncbi:MAG TPA: serine hydrolase domain-containing protein [Polyangiaceae bacterium]|nr:serine hydrolase domain-containing protein [Polyangiaceae bacterium]
MYQKVHAIRPTTLTALAQGTLVAAFLLASASTSAQPADAQSGAAPAVSTTASGGFEEGLRAELDSYIQNALTEFDVPGAAVAILKDGKVAYRGAFGQRGDQHPAPVDSQTLFMIGSVTKSMTATMTGTLVDDGILSWDAPVKQYLPTFALAVPEYSESVTLRHLLSHQSGVSRRDIALFLAADRPLEMLQAVSTLPVHSAPGQSYEYQNQMYALSGLITARAAGARLTNQSLEKTYERLMQTRLFDRVGMPRTTLDFDRAMHSPNHAWPNEFSPLEGRVTHVQPSFENFATGVAAAGGVWSNIDDMARYALMQVSEGKNPEGRRVISEAALEETHTQMVPGEQGGYGLGWGVALTPFGKLIQHSGGTAGFGCDVALSPEHDWGIVVLTNRASSTWFVQAVENYAASVLLGIERRDDAELLNAEAAFRAQISQLVALTVPASRAEVAQYLGAYEGGISVGLRGSDLIIRTSLGELQARPVPAYPGGFVMVGNVLSGAVAYFASDEAGNMTLTLGALATEGEEVSILQPETRAKLPPGTRPQRPRGFPQVFQDGWREMARQLHARGVHWHKHHPELFR